MKIMVTGGAGFIGSHIVDAYISNGHDVCVVDDLSSGFRHNLPDGVRFYELDIRSQTLVNIFELERPDVVNHQAARANVRESFEAPLLYADVNVVGSVNLLECCRKFGVRKVIYASTGGAVYGEPSSLPVSEEHPINPLDPYGASKHHVEHYLSIYKKHYGTDFTALRYPNVYGPRQNPEGEAGVVAIFIGRMISGKRPIINGTGNQERDFVYVGDIAKASVLALDCAGGEILNLGSGIGTSVNHIHSTLSELTNFPSSAEHGPPKDGEVKKIYLQSDRARRLLKWEAQIPLCEGLTKTVDFFRSLPGSAAHP